MEIKCNGHRDVIYEFYNPNSNGEHLRSENTQVLRIVIVNILYNWVCIS